MALSRRTAISSVVLVVLGAVVALAYWHQVHQKKPGQAEDSAAINVTSGEDRGPGSLREALFIAAAAHGEATINVRVPKITLMTALPPIVSSQGVQVIGLAESGTEIDASGLAGGPVFDIATANASFEGLRIHNCKAAGVLLRAEHFRMESSSVQACDIGVDVAENAKEVLLERNRFTANRVGVRFAASNRNTTLVKNEFSDNRDAGVWAVRAEPDRGGSAISVRENRFTNERVGILAANVSIAIERNEVLASGEMAMQLMGTGAVVRGNRVSGGEGMGIVAENSRGVVIENNELDGLEAYGIMIKASADALVRNNRVHNSGYGLAFVIGTSPSTAIENTIIEPKSNGIDVIGDSPVLRNNRVLRPRTLAFKAVDFEGGGQRVQSHPFLEGNNFDARGIVVADRAAASDKPSTVLSNDR
jgi:parallel beta-helix repeat protein